PIWIEYQSLWLTNINGVLEQWGIGIDQSNQRRTFRAELSNQSGRHFKCPKFTKIKVKSWFIRYYRILIRPFDARSLRYIERDQCRDGFSTDEGIIDVDDILHRKHVDLFTVRDRTFTDRIGDGHDKFLRSIQPCGRIDFPGIVKEGLRLPVIGKGGIPSLIQKYQITFTNGERRGVKWYRICGGVQNDFHLPSGTAHLIAIFDLDVYIKGDIFRNIRYRVITIGIVQIARRGPGIVQVVAAKRIERDQPRFTHHDGGIRGFYAIRYVESSDKRPGAFIVC